MMLEESILVRRIQSYFDGYGDTHLSAAGDTAQCISKDSVFRFPEIKALFYGYYDSISDQTSQPELARPRQFALSKNYRSHQGILSLASFVMQMLWTGTF